MKNILFISIFLISLCASSLENILTHADLGNIEDKKDNYGNQFFYPIIFSDYYEKVEVSISDNAKGKEIKKLQGFINNVYINRNSVSSYEKEIKEKKLKDESLKNKNEVKIFPYFKLTYLPKKVPKFEKIIIHFNIDDHKNIQNLDFIQKSIFTVINEDFKKAIYQARFDFIKKNNEDIVLYYKILYK
ncbi:hypothetical protein [Halarcobacter ebronensis]|uniref:Uncharacterized protein n=1 Tax=Halarcobacter ebronensis TaxID=1462615 RepID=A0A4Q1AXR6_9BACT|nr:hypothetical protein [Halarcobacter ebronensis]QKF83416.1 hypothetical protein AEBR_2965 [Halarcobacter ebronensis]RXK05975.1 hypothetical protein CRV07_07850 [Halarcobacter ebronensis]